MLTVMNWGGGEGGVMMKNRVTHPECPVSIDSDNEVDDVDEKHDGIHVTHRTVIRMDDVIEKLSYGQVNVKSTGGKKKRRTSDHLYCY